MHGVHNALLIMALDEHQSDCMIKFKIVLEKENTKIFKLKNYNSKWFKVFFNLIKNIGIINYILLSFYVKIFLKLIK